MNQTRTQTMAELERAAYGQPAREARVAKEGEFFVVMAITRAVGLDDFWCNVKHHMQFEKMDAAYDLVQRVNARGSLDIRFWVRP